MKLESMKTKVIRNKLGQNTAEYILMLVLVAVGSIGVFTVFGATMRNQAASVVAAFGGDSAKFDSGQTAAASGATAASTMATRKLQLGHIDKSEVDGVQLK